MAKVMFLFFATEKVRFRAFSVIEMSLASHSAFKVVLENFLDVFFL